MAEARPTSTLRRFVTAALLAVVLANWAPKGQLLLEGGIDPSWRQALSAFIGQRFTSTCFHPGYLATPAPESKTASGKGFSTPE